MTTVASITELLRVHWSHSRYPHSETARTRRHRVRASHRQFLRSAVGREGEGEVPWRPSNQRVRPLNPPRHLDRTVATHLEAALIE